MKMHLAPPGTNQAANDNAVLDETHIGHINGALGTIAQGDIATPPRPVAQDQDPARHHWPRAHRHGGRQ
jgi:hypothetical protein